MGRFVTPVHRLTGVHMAFVGHHGQIGAMLLISMVLSGAASGVRAQCPGTWVQAASVGPSPRAESAMAYDSARGVCVLFGGDSNGDTWEWDGLMWTCRSTGKAGEPSPRTVARMVYDPAAEACLLAGGASPNGSTLSDTWAWDGTSWSQLSSVGPSPARIHFAMAHDPIRQRTVLFGGENRQDTWEWNGVVWSRVATSGPPGRTQAAATFDPIRARVCLFGGYFNGTFFNDTWEWDGSSWSQRMLSLAPPARYNPGLMGFDARGSILLFSGITASGPFPADTWELGSTGWSDMTSPGPEGRSAPAIAYDSRRRHFVMFGGADGNGRLGETWVWSDAPVLTSGPNDVAICTSGQAQLHILAAGFEKLSYRWEIEREPDVWRSLADGPVQLSCGVANAAGADTHTVSISIADCPGPWASSYRVRAVVSNLCTSSTSNAATLTLCPADFDCTGFVDLDDFGEFVAAFELGSANADFDGTGFVDTDDFTAFVLAFERGC